MKTSTEKLVGLLVLCWFAGMIFLAGAATAHMSLAAEMNRLKLAATRCDTVIHSSMFDDHCTAQSDDGQCGKFL